MYLKIDKQSKEKETGLQIDANPISLKRESE